MIKTIKARDALELISGYSSGDYIFQKEVVHGTSTGYGVEIWGDIVFSFNDNYYTIAFTKGQDDHGNTFCRLSNAEQYDYEWYDGSAETDVPVEQVRLQKETIIQEVWVPVSESQ